MSHPTQRPWRISYKCPDAIICIGEPENNGDYYGGKLICESVEPSNARLIIKAVNSHDKLVLAAKEAALLLRESIRAVGIQMSECPGFIRLLEAIEYAEKEA